MQRIRGLSYFAGIELKEINHLLAEREQLVLQTIETRMQQAEVSGENVDSIKREVYQLIQAFSGRLTALEEVAGQVIVNLLSNIERRSL
jgi:hypothetical protein